MKKRFKIISEDGDVFHATAKDIRQALAWKQIEPVGDGTYRPRPAWEKAMEDSVRRKLARQGGLSPGDRALVEKQKG